MSTGKTSAPSLLTEADLIATMDRNGIGTDATIAEHIKKILERNYVIKERNFFLPTSLGLALVEGYDNIGFNKSLAKPQLRKEMEQDMNSICRGNISKNQVIRRAIDQFYEMFIKSLAESDKLKQAFEKYFGHEAAAADENIVGAKFANYPPAERSDEFRCDCGEPSVKLKVQKRTDNYGKIFYACAEKKCEFFKWNEDAGTGAINQNRVQTTVMQPFHVNENSSTKPKCSCGLIAILKTVSKDGPNKGKGFWMCSKVSNTKCSFFEWADENAVTANNTYSRQETSRKPATRKTTTKKKGSASKCYKCGKVSSYKLYLTI
jgi:DNA topoisomerase-3